MIEYRRTCHDLQIRPADTESEGEASVVSSVDLAISAVHSHRDTDLGNYLSQAQGTSRQVKHINIE